MRAIAVFCLFSVFVAMALAPASAMNVYVKPNEEQCFFEEAKRGDKLIGSFNVAQGGFLDIDIKVTGPDGKTIYEAEREKDGSFQFVALQDGAYRTCFGNTMSTVTGKTVSFRIYVGNSLSQHDAAKKEHLNPLETSISMLGEAIYQIRTMQDYQTTRERVCKATNQSTNSRAFWWNFLELVVLVSISGFQMFYIRYRFFENNQKR